MPAKIKTKDKGWNQIKSRLVDLKRNPVSMTVGVHSDAGTYPNGTEVVAVAVIQEFGIGVPEQPFIRPVFDADSASHRAMLRRVAEGAVRSGRDPTRALKALGDRLAARMKARAPVESGRLRASLEARVKR
jgi:hypothetical protein